MEKNVVFFQYSKGLLALGAALLIPLIFLAYELIHSVLRTAHADHLLEFINVRIISQPQILIRVLLALFLLCLSGLYLLVLISEPSRAHMSYTAQIVFSRAYPVIIWAWVMLFQALIFFVILAILAGTGGVRQDSFSEGYDQDLIVFLILTLTGLHALTLLFEATWLDKLPTWVWAYKSIEINASLLYPLFAGLVGSLFFIFIFKKLSRPWAAVPAVALLFILMQLSFGLALGNGFEGMRQNYAGQKISKEMQYACVAQEGIPGLVRDYDSLYTDNFWLGTKPPGMLVFFVLFRDVAATFMRGAMTDPSVCFFSLTQLSTFIMPVLASLVLIPMYCVWKSLSESDPESELSSSSTPFLLFLVIPSLTLFFLIRDQFLFPVFFMSVIFCLDRAVSKGAWGWALITGVSIYLALFMSFSLLPVLSICLFYPVLSRLPFQTSTDRKSVLTMLVGIAAGFIFLWLAGKLLLDYDPVLRYQQAIRNHVEIKDFQLTLPNLVEYSWLNNLEFMNWVGLPVFLLFISGVIRSGLEIFKGNIARKDALFLSVGITYILMNLIGQTKGEVGRIWIFLVPMMAMIAAAEIHRLFKRPAAGRWLTAALQFITVLLVSMTITFGK